MPLIFSFSLSLWDAGFVVPCSVLNSLSNEIYMLPIKIHNQSIEQNTEEMMHCKIQ